MKKIFSLACFAILTPFTFAYADAGGFSNSGGTLPGGSRVGNPQGSLTIAAGTLAFLSTDGSTSINATFASSSTVESCSGGGKGGHVTCSFTFKGTFNGTLTVNGATQAIIGSTYQLYGTDGVVISGRTGYNSAYTPFYFSNTGQILRSDDLNGTNLVSYGTQGSDVGQFYGAYGIAVDSAGRIYVSDTYNARIVRIDDMNGTNWTSFGTYGSDIGQFANPGGISIDAAGRIYVMDTGNNRLVRMDDMNGTNWTVFSGLGSGDGQFAQYVAPVALDASGRIYVADTGNRRIVRMDDMNGTNWTTLTQSPVIYIYIYSFGSPVGVAVDGAGRIYVADGYQPSVIRVDDMSGTNWTAISLGSGATPHSIAVDRNGMVLVGGGGAQIVDNMAGVLTSSSALTQYYGPYYVFGATPVPLPSPPPSAIRFSPPSLSFSQNMGTTSPAQTITITNFGGSPLNGLNLSSNGGFSQTNNCPAVVTAGSNCSVSVTFTPQAVGLVTGALTVTDDSGNMGAMQVVPLNGTGTTPAASATPSSLSFPSQVLGTTSTARTITLQSTGTGPLQGASVAITGPFSQTNNCSGSIAPGSSCTIQVTFVPVVLGSASGTVTITDNAGTQTVSLTGNGSAPVSLSPASLNFGTLAVGNTSSTKTITVTNRLNVALNFTSISSSGPFAVAASSTCGMSLAAGSSCTVGIIFSPTALGSATGVVTFTDSALTSPQTVNLTGTGTTPVTFSTNSLSFNTTVVGNTSTARTVTMTNQQNVALNNINVAASAGFVVATDSCSGATLAPAASCSVGVTFAPAAVGSITGALTFTDDTPNSPQTVTLSGTGSAPVTFSSSSLNFGTITVGTTSSTKTVTVTNRLNVALSFSSIGATDAFAVAPSSTCSTSLAAGAICTVGVTFSPTAVGSVTGALTFTDGAATSPQSVSLSGAGR